MALTDPLLAEIRNDARKVEQDDPVMRPIAHSVLVQPSFTHVLAARLANKMAGPVVKFSVWFPVMVDVMEQEYDPKLHPGFTVSDMAREDLRVIQERDPAAESSLFSLLYFKGYLGIQANRVAHVLWRCQRKALALQLQSRVSQVFAMDIHPAATLGHELMIDHGTGVVIGETCVIGNRCTLLHGVTLGATGKDHGQRHPLLGDDVLIGAGVSVLGRITLGNQCKIGASSVVLKSIPEGATAIGCPAKVVGKVKEAKPGSEMDSALSNVLCSMECEEFKSIWRKLDERQTNAVGCMNYKTVQGKLLEFNPNLTPCQVDAVLFFLDEDLRGTITQEAFMHRFQEAMIKVKAPHCPTGLDMSIMI